MDQAQIRERLPATDRHPNHWATPLSWLQNNFTVFITSFFCLTLTNCCLRNSTSRNMQYANYFDVRISFRYPHLILLFVYTKFPYNTATWCSLNWHPLLLIRGAIKKFCISVWCTNGTDKTIALFFNVISFYINTSDICHKSLDSSQNRRAAKKT